MIDFLSNSIVLFFILIIVLFGMLEKKNVLELFLNGVKEGGKIIIQLFPTLLALMIAVGMLNKSGFLYFVSDFIYLVLRVF